MEAGASSGLLEQSSKQDMMLAVERKQELLGFWLKQPGDLVVTFTEMERGGDRKSCRREIKH